jgi:hypothetical protein
VPPCIVLLITQRCTVTGVLPELSRSCGGMQMLEYHQHPDVARIAGRLVRHVTVVQTCWHRLVSSANISWMLPMVDCILYIP